MKSKVTQWAMAIAFSSLLLGAVRDARAADADCQNAPMVKNLRAYTTRCTAQASGPKQLTRKEVKHLAATAKSAEDHLKLARYYEAEAERLDAQGAGYEEAAARYRREPAAKNLMAPGTVPHYEYLARGFRDEAQSARALAASHEQMVKNAGAQP